MCVPGGGGAACLCTVVLITTISNCRQSVGSITTSEPFLLCYYIYSGLLPAGWPSLQGAIKVGAIIRADQCPIIQPDSQWVDLRSESHGFGGGRGLPPILLYSGWRGISHPPLQSASQGLVMPWGGVSESGSEQKGLEMKGD